MGRLGRVGFKTFTMFIFTTVLAVLLGLFLVKRIAEAHGGGVSARSQAGGGARVGFEVAARA